MNIRKLTAKQVIGSKDCGYSLIDHRRQSKASLIVLQTFS